MKGLAGLVLGGGCEHGDDMAEGLIRKPILRDAGKVFQLELDLPYGGSLRLELGKVREFGPDEEKGPDGEGGSVGIQFQLRRAGTDEWVQVTQENHKTLSPLERHAVGYLRSKFDKLADIVRFSDNVHR